MSNELFIPQGCRPLSQIKEIPQIRLGLQGFGGTGKTWAALTFPNPIVANLDRGLGAHIGREDVIEIPFYDTTYIKQNIDPNYSGGSKKDVLLKWLETNGPKLKPHQTLIWDGNTSTQNSYHVWYEANKHKFLTRDGKINEFAEWAEKTKFYSIFFDILKTLPCHVVLICHEVDKKEKTGSYVGKVRPLLTGQMGDELMTHFTDWFRQHVSSKPKDFNALTEDQLRMWKLNKDEFKAMCDTFKGESLYYWQSESDDIFDAKASSLVNAPRFMAANYSSYERFRRKLV